MGRGRAPCCDKNKVKRGPWSPAEDLRLITFIQNHGHSNWRSLPKQAGLLRCGKSCRLRWVNYLRPDVKRGNFTPEEEQTIINLHNSIGNKWSKIASYLPGRTDNEIKNVWNTHLKKRLMPNNNASDHRKDSKTSCSASPSCASSSITSSGDQNMDKAVGGDQGLQESEVKKPDESPGSLNLKKPTHPIDHHKEAKEAIASDSPISPTSSYASNFSNFNNGPNEASESLKNKAINPKGGDADAIEIEIPLESDVEFWELLDCLDPSQCGKTVENGGNQDSNLTKPEENLDNEIECSKWLRFLENDLGLASDVENQPKGQNMIPTIPVLAKNLEPQISPGLDYFPIWPSSPQNLGI